MKSGKHRTLELRGGAHNLETTQVSRMKAALFAVPSSDLLGAAWLSSRSPL